MKSTEWPDLEFVEPRSWTSGRDGWSNVPRVLVIHYTAGSEGPTSAENGAAYDQRRTDGTSSHYYVDSDSVVQCVLTKHMAHTARYTGNRIGIHYELCGTRQTRVEWLDDTSYATMRLAARQVARDAAKYGIPVRSLTAAQVAAGESGICGHDDITHAFPSDGGTHTDPGAEFPWDVFIALVEVENMTMTVEELQAAIKDIRIATAPPDWVGGPRDETRAADLAGAIGHYLTGIRNLLETSSAEILAKLEAQSTGGIDVDAIAEAIAEGIASKLGETITTAVNTAIREAAATLAESSN